MAAAQLPPRIARIGAGRGMGDLTRVFALTVAERRRGRARAVYVFEDGCVLGGDVNDACDHFRWDDVERLTRRTVGKPMSGSWRSTVTYGIGLIDGRTLQVSGAHGPEVEGFGALAEAGVTAAQLPGMAAALERGEPVTFGERFRVTPEGLYRSAVLGKRLSWSDVDEVTVEHGEVLVRSHDRDRVWGSASTDFVPNLCAFVTLVRSVAQRSQRAS
jgi:hypothetical protein